MDEDNQSTEPTKEQLAGAYRELGFSEKEAHDCVELVEKVQTKGAESLTTDEHARIGEYKRRAESFVESEESENEEISEEKSE